MPSKKKKDTTPEPEKEAMTTMEAPSEEATPAIPDGDFDATGETAGQGLETGAGPESTTAEVDEITAEGLADQDSSLVDEDGAGAEAEPDTAAASDPTLTLPAADVDGDGFDDTDQDASGNGGPEETGAADVDPAAPAGDSNAVVTDDDMSPDTSEDGEAPVADGLSAPMGDEPVTPEEGDQAPDNDGQTGDGSSADEDAPADSVVDVDADADATGAGAGEDSEPLPQAAAKKPAKKAAKKPAKKTKADGAAAKPAVKTAVKPAEVAAARPGFDVLTIERGDDVENPNDTEAVVWHDMQNANRTKRILTGRVGGVERNEAGGTVVVVYYRGLRILIPASEMNIRLAADPSGRFGDAQSRQNKIANNMLGAEIDFMIMGIDGRTRSVVASRKAAMLRKARMFYFPASGNALPQIYPGRLVQARVIAVGEKVVRVEVFGVEHSIMASRMSWDWVGDARERYQVGDEIIVKVLKVNGDDPDSISIDVSARDVTGNSAEENLKKIVLQGKYAGTITDIRKGVVYIHLEIGVNAIAHACYDSRRPGRRDVVSFVATTIDWETGVALGIISRIIKRQL